MILYLHLVSSLCLPTSSKAPLSGYLEQFCKHMLCLCLEERNFSVSKHAYIFHFSLISPSFIQAKPLNLNLVDLVCAYIFVALSFFLFVCSDPCCQSLTNASLSRPYILQLFQSVNTFIEMLKSGKEHFFVKVTSHSLHSLIQIHQSISFIM